jgi:hypothetical protein
VGLFSFEVTKVTSSDHMEDLKFLVLHCLARLLRRHVENVWCARINPLPPMFIESPISGPSPPTTVKVSEELPNSDLFQLEHQPQVSAPSEIFENQRIIGVILEHFEHDKSLEAARKNLRLAALTSKAFLEPAMNSLWSSLDSLIPLLSLLPFAPINNVYVSQIF